MVVLPAGTACARPALRRVAAWLIVVGVFGVALGVTTALAAMAVPWIAQKSASDCGRAVLASLAARRHGNAEAIYRRIPDPADRERGYSIPEMRRLGARVGVGLSIMAPAGVVIAGDCTARPAVAAHLARVARRVAAGGPVVVPVGGYFGGHYLILVGVSGDRFAALDPASPGLKSISSGQLSGQMCGFGYVALAAR
jgi:ABC-type bacteriocin/lantibiotic exporter with double-glycine peptidase domain